METRKQEEIDFHNQLRDPALRTSDGRYKKLTANKKYYSVTLTSTEFFHRWLLSNCAGRRVLDYGCGDGQYSMLVAGTAAQVIGVDLSDVSIANCRRTAAERGLTDKARFEVMDCESLSFDDNSFDLVCESGVLHHLDISKAFRELSRVVRPGGHVICYEALGHNLLFQAYRQLTPHLRTRFETQHILSTEHLALAGEYFGDVRVKFFHLCALAAVPFRRTPLFGPLLKCLNRIDDVLLEWPALGRQAWIMVFVLSNPEKAHSAARASIQ